MKLIRTGRCVLALLLALTLLAGAAALAAEPVDLAQSCSLTLTFAEAAAADDSAAGESTPTYEEQQSAAEKQELQAARVQIAAYKLADAELQTGYDAYTFAFTDAFAGLAEYYSADGMDTAAVKELAAQAQALVTDAMEPKTGVKAADETEATVADLEPGLYLVLLRTAGQEFGTVQTDSFTYSYSPVIVSLPTREAEDGADAVAMTSDTGAWTYDVSVNLVNKGEVEPTLASVYISKTYTAATTGVTCIFEVTATKYGETVLNNVYSMFFAAGETAKTLEIPGLPAGAEVTVTEVYAGAGAKQTGSDNTQFTVTAGDDAANTASFTNTQGDDAPQSGSVANAYTAAESDLGDTINWTVTQQLDSMQ